jgi:GTP-binding protein HflX
MLAKIEEYLHSFKKKYSLIIPYSNQSALSALYDSYTVDNVEYADEGITLDVILDEKGKGIYGKYIVSV